MTRRGELGIGEVRRGEFGIDEVRRGVVGREVRRHVQLR